MVVAAVGAALVDVGGTLWPDRWQSSRVYGALLQARLQAARPSLSSGQVGDLLGALDRAAATVDDDAAQDTDRLIASALQAIGERPEYSGPVAVGKIRTAMCLPVTPHIGLFPDAWSLLAEIREADVRCVLVTNAVWRDTAAYWHDLESLGVAHAVDAVVSSVDVGFRKPHPAIFAAAVAASGCAPTACVMIGNSERADIQPALRLGMHTIRVAIEEPLPASSTAHLLTDSLLSAAAQVRAWRTQPTQPSQTG